MKHYLKLFTSILFVFIVVVGLSACGTSLQKPSGLEATESEETQLDDTKEELKEADDGSKEIELDDSDLSKVEAEQAKNGSSEKVIDAKEENEKSTSDATKQEEEVSKPSSENAKEPSASNAKEPAKSASAKSENTSQATETTKQSAEPKPKPKPKPVEKPKEKPVEKPKPEPKKNMIVHSIVISSSEVPLPPTEMEIKDGDTVLQALIEITMAKKIHMDYRGGQGATAYIQGMGNVYEFDRGQGSGWMYRVNGIFPDRGAGVVPLLGGDRVEWLYTTNLGVDLGANLQPFRR